MAGGVAAVALGASVASAGITTIDMTIQTDTFDNFRYSVLHTAESNNGMSGSIIAEFTGTMRIEHDDNGTASTGDDTVTVTRFDGNIAGTGRSTDMRLDASRGASVFTLDAGTTVDGGHRMSGDLNLQIFDGGTWKSVPYSFSSSVFNSLANQFFIGGDPQDPSAEYTLGLWGLSDNPDNLMGETSDLGIDLVARGQAIPMPTPLAMAGLSLAGIAGARRRR
jgi:hypothetical protein